MNNLMKEWRAQLVASGFTVLPKKAWRSAGVLRHDIFLEASRNRSAKSTFKIGVEILIEDRFVLPPAHVVCLRANVQRSGIFFGESDSSWWSLEEARNSFEFLTPDVLRWFAEFGEALKLSEYLEKAMVAKSDIEELMEPSPPAHPELEALTNSLRRVRRSPPIYHYYLSLLKHSLRDDESACRHARVWLQHLIEPPRISPDDREIQRTKAQLVEMGCS